MQCCPEGLEIPRSWRSNNDFWPCPLCRRIGFVCLFVCWLLFGYCLLFLLPQCQLFWEVDLLIRAFLVWNEKILHCLMFSSKIKHLSALYYFLHMSTCYQISLAAQWNCDYVVFRNPLGYMIHQFVVVWLMSYLFQTHFNPIFLNLQKYIWNGLHVLVRFIIYILIKNVTSKLKVGSSRCVKFWCDNKKKKSTEN